MASPPDSAPAAASSASIRILPRTLRRNLPESAKSTWVISPTKTASVAGNRRSSIERSAAAAASASTGSTTGIPARTDTDPGVRRCKRIRARTCHRVVGPPRALCGGHPP